MAALEKSARPGALSSRIIAVALEIGAHRLAPRIVYRVEVLSPVVGDQPLRFLIFRIVLSSPLD